MTRAVWGQIAGFWDTWFLGVVPVWWGGLERSSAPRAVFSRKKQVGMKVFICQEISCLPQTARNCPKNYHPIDISERVLSSRGDWGQFLELP